MLFRSDNFLVFAFIGVVLMIAGGLYRPLAKRFVEGRLLRAGVMLMIVGLGGLGVVAAVVHRQADAGGRLPAVEGLFYVAAAVAVVGFAFVNPSVSALISRHTDPERQGEVLGVNQSFASLGRILSPFLGSLLFSLHASGGLPFMLAVAALLAVVALLRRSEAVPAS